VHELTGRGGGRNFLGLFTHFARADETDAAATRTQIAHFEEVLAKLGEDAPRWIHVSNSASVLTQRFASRVNMVRLGIAMYGLDPSPEVPAPPTLRPCMAFKTQLAQVKTLPPGRGISYGHRFVTDKPTRVGTIPAGYADGWRRVLGNRVLVGGQEAPVLGTVCMDQCIISLENAPDARPGDEVVLFGTQDTATIPVRDVARRWATIDYEVTCGLLPRVRRVYHPLP